MTDAATQPCPGCEASVRANPRYPGFFCAACVQTAASTDGRLIEFGNVNRDQALPGMTVGAIHRDDGSSYPSENCLVRNIPARAREARFGGVVVQPIAVWERTGQQ